MSKSKKPSFLSKKAVLAAMAAALASGAAGASMSPDLKDRLRDAASGVELRADFNTQELLLQPASIDNEITTAAHYSHRSHQSHQSHSSHYSSYP